MKKILLATTLLAATAGYASAEVAVSGSARMGLIYNGTDAAFSSRVRIGFAGTGTTDGGLTFGASMRADQSGGNSTDTGETNGSSTVYISGAFGTLTMGDTGNAVDDIVGQVSGIGYGPGLLDGAADVSMLDNAIKTAVYYKYTAGAFTVGVGAGQVNAANDYKSIAVGYAAGAFSVGLGYEDDGTDNVVSAKGTGTFGPATVKVKIADSTRPAFPDLGYAVSVDYAMGAATITGFYADNNKVDAQYGIGAAYDLGGGAAVKGGVGSVVVGGTSETVADLGVTMSF